jgi:hypothetical protein
MWTAEETAKIAELKRVFPLHAHGYTAGQKQLNQMKHLVGAALSRVLSCDITGVFVGRTVKYRERACVIIGVDPLTCCRADDGTQQFRAEASQLFHDDDVLHVIGPFPPAEGEWVRNGLVPLDGGWYKVLRCEIRRSPLSPPDNTMDLPQLVQQLDGVNRSPGLPFWEKSGDAYVTPFETATHVVTRVDGAACMILMVPPAAVQKLVPPDGAVLTKHPFLWSAFRTVEELEGAPLECVIVDGIQLLERAMALRYSTLVVVLHHPTDLTLEVVDDIAALCHITGFEILSDATQTMEFIRKTLTYRREVPPLITEEFVAVTPTPRERKLKTVEELNRVDQDVRQQFERECRRLTLDTFKLPECYAQLPACDEKLEVGECLCGKRIRGSQAVTPDNHVFHWECICKALLQRSVCPRDNHPCTFSQLRRLKGSPACSKLSHLPPDCVVLTDANIKHGIPYRKAEQQRSLHNHKVVCVLEGHPKEFSDRARHNLMRHFTGKEMVFRYFYFEKTCEEINLFGLKSV